MVLSATLQRACSLNQPKDVTAGLMRKKDATLPAGGFKPFVVKELTKGHPNRCAINRAFGFPENLSAVVGEIVPELMRAD